MPDDFNPNIHDREYWGDEDQEDDCAMTNDEKELAIAVAEERIREILMSLERDAGVEIDSVDIVPEHFMRVEILLAS